VEEIAYPRIITVAVDNFAAEMIFVMSQFILDIRQLGVKLVFLLRFRLMQVPFADTA